MEGELLQKTHEKRVDRVDLAVARMISSGEAEELFLKDAYYSACIHDEIEVYLEEINAYTDLYINQVLDEEEQTILDGIIENDCETFEDFEDLYRSNLKDYYEAVENARYCREELWK
jgi:hypothetical protein